MVTKRNLETKIFFENLKIKNKYRNLEDLLEISKF